MARQAAQAYVGGAGDFTTHHTISVPATIYLSRHGLDPATGNALPGSNGVLNNDSDSGVDALLYGALTTILYTGLMDDPADYDQTGYQGTTGTAVVPNRSLACIGLTTGGIRLRKEQDTVVYNSDQLRGNFDEDATSNLWAVDCSMEELNLWNLALAWGRSTSAIGSSSMMLMKAGDQEFHALQLVTKGPQLNSNNSVSALRRARRVYEFFKIKAWANGEIPHSREDVQSIPVTFMAYCDGNENWGLLFDAYHDFSGGSAHVAEAIPTPAYNTAPTSLAS